MDQSQQIKRKVNPRENANLFSLLTFYYMRKLFTRGFRKDLEDDDLYEVVKSCKSKRITDKLDHAYHGESKKSKPSTYKVLWNVFGLRYVGLGLIHLTSKLLEGALEPYAISQMVSFFKPDQKKLFLADAIYYACMLLGLKLWHAIYHSNYIVYMEQISLQMRTALSSLLYRKALRLSPRSLEKTSLGNIITMINKDAAQIQVAMYLINDIWIGAVQILYMCYLIHGRVGIPSSFGILILISVIPIQYFISMLIKKLRTKLNKKTDIRLQETQEALSTIRIIKMYTWEKFFANRINETRRKEIKTLLIKSITRGGLIVAGDFVSKIGFYVIIILYLYFSSTGITAETIFYVMKTYSIIRLQILFVFTYGFTLTAELVASIKRIDSMLQLEDLPEINDKPDDEPQIDIRDVDVNLKDKDILKRINFKLAAGLNIVTGQLGSGKSSLIKMILREYPPDSGELRTRGRKSYASQDPWLFPATIKQNILFGETYDYERYNKVIEVCALSYDLDILENGDETIVQDRGMNLSKGQQARINLARAIYKESDIYLIDDALTALDTGSQDHIFKECIEDFLKGKLVVFVTHNVKHIARCDTVVVLENGYVKYTGKQKELSKELLSALEEPTPETPTEETRSEEMVETTNLLPEKNESYKKKIYHEDKKSGGIAFEVYSKYIKYGGGLFFLIFIIGIYAGSTFSESSAQIMLTKWVNYESVIAAMKQKNFGNPAVNTKDLYSTYFQSNSSTDPTRRTLDTQTVIHAPLTNPIQSTAHNSHTINYPNYTVSTNNLWSVNRSILSEEQNKTYNILLEIDSTEHQANRSLNIYSLLILLVITLDFFKQFVTFKFGTNASITLHKHMIRNVIYSKMTFFDRFFVGNILNRFSQDLYIVDEYLLIIISLVIEAGFAFLGIAAMLGHVNWKFMISALTLLIILFSLRMIYMPTARSLKRLEAATRSSIVGHINSSLEGLTTIRAYKAQDILKNEFDRHQDLYSSARFLSLCAQNAFAFYMEFTTILLFAYIIARFLFFETDTPAGDVGLTLTQASSIGLILQYGISYLNDVENQLTSAERAMEFTKLDTESDKGLETPNWPSSGEVVFDNVSLNYTYTNEKVLQDISFKVNPGEKIGIVGRTGAGKSSIIATLFRLYNYEGAVYIDNVDTKNLSLKYLRTHISIIPQDPILFSGTIRTNIDPENEFTDEELWKALHKVHLDTKIVNLQMQVDDTNFSSGERQLLSLARAIVRKNKIVVLDEATANMDPETEEMVQKAIDSNFSSCTVFIIAHRLSCILNCNQVIVLKRGQIIEYDDPAALMNNANSYFAKAMKNSGIH